MAFADTAAMVLQHVPESVDQQEQFYVDVEIDPNGTSFNGAQGSVTFSNDTISFVRAETGSSIVTYFITPPTLQDNTVTFSGIILGGFNGLINPFDQSHKLPGHIMRLVFAAKAQGTATIDTHDSTVTANDGEGTLQSASSAHASFPVSDAVAISKYVTPDITLPTISASVVQEHALFDGRYTLIFTATDKQSGIDHVELQEGGGAWNTVQSPYLLHDQSRKSILSLRAYDASGNVATITVAPISSSSTTIALIILIFILLITLYVIHKKSKHPTHLA
jgi:hypothetical protein